MLSPPCTPGLCTGSASPPTCIPACRPVPSHTVEHGAKKSEAPRASKKGRPQGCYAQSGPWPSTPMLDSAMCATGVLRSMCSIPPLPGDQVLQPLPCLGPMCSSPCLVPRPCSYPMPSPRAHILQHQTPGPVPTFANGPSGACYPLHAPLTFTVGSCCTGTAQAIKKNTESGSTHSQSGSTRSQEAHTFGFQRRGVECAGCGRRQEHGTARLLQGAGRSVLN